MPYKAQRLVCRLSDPNSSDARHAGWSSWLTEAVSSCLYISCSQKLESGAGLEVGSAPSEEWGQLEAHRQQGMTGSWNARSSTIHSLARLRKVHKETCLSIELLGGTAAVASDQPWRHPRGLDMVLGPRSILWARVQYASQGQQTTKIKSVVFWVTIVWSTGSLAGHLPLARRRTRWVKVRRQRERLVSPPQTLSRREPTIPRDPVPWLSSSLKKSDAKLGVPGFNVYR